MIDWSFPRRNAVCCFLRAQGLQRTFLLLVRRSRAGRRFIQVLFPSFCSEEEEEEHGAPPRLSGAHQAVPAAGASGCRCAALRADRAVAEPNRAGFQRVAVEEGGRRRRRRHLCNFILTLHFIMSAEEGDAGPVAGDPAAKQRLTWEESDPLGSQGRPQPDGEEEPQPGEDEDEEEEAEGRARAADAEKISGEENGGNTSSEEGAVGGRCGKTQAMPSTCSSETCIPTPSCRICFQGAEQVGCWFYWVYWVWSHICHLLDPIRSQTAVLLVVK